jgi:hypothetical protein
MALSWKRSLIYGVILTIAAVTYWVYSETSGPRFDQGLQKREADMKMTLPRKVDDITTLEDVKYEGTKNVYWLSIDAGGGSIDASDLQHRTQSLLCSNGDIARTIKEKGFSYEYHYVNKERVSLATFTIADCP